MERTSKNWLLINMRNIVEEWNYPYPNSSHGKLNIMYISTAIIPSVQQSHVILTTVRLAFSQKYDFQCCMLNVLQGEGITYHESASLT